MCLLFVKSSWPLGVRRILREMTLISKRVRALSPTYLFFCSLSSCVSASQIECDGNRNPFNIGKGPFARTNSIPGHTAISGSNPSIKDDGRYSYLQELRGHAVSSKQTIITSSQLSPLIPISPSRVFLHIMFEIQKAAM